MEENQDKSPKEDIDISTPETIQEEKIDPDKLEPNPLNGSIYGKEDIRGLYESIKEDGLEKVLLVNENYRIVSGHLRYQAFQELRKKHPNKEKFELISVKVQHFDSEEEEIKHLLTSNETRDTSDLQKVFELEQWEKLMKWGKYPRLSTEEKRKLIIDRVKLRAKRTYDKARRVLKFINKLKEDNSKAEELKEILKKFQSFSLGAMEKEVANLEDEELKELTPPTMKELLTAGEEKLKEISNRYRLKLRPEMYYKRRNSLRAFAEKIAEKLKELGLDLVETDDEEVKKHWKSVGYETLKDMNKHELKSVVDTLGLSVDLDYFMGFQNSIFFAKEIAKKLNISNDPLSGDEISNLELEDLEHYAESKGLNSKIEKNENDPLKKHREVVAEHLGVKEELRAALRKNFNLNRYRKKYIPLEYGRLKVGVTPLSNKGESLTVELRAGNDKKRTEKIVELLENIDSGNIESLIAEARKSRSGIDFDTP